MTATLVHYVEFHIPRSSPSGRIFTRTQTAIIVSRDIKRLAIPQDAVGFKFYDVQTAVENGIIMRSDPINISGTHFCGGQIIMAKKAITVIFDPRLLKKIESEKWQRVILCNDGEFREFKHGDVIVLRSKKVEKKEG